MLDVEITQIESFRVACVRHVGPYPEMAPAFGEVFAWAGAAGRMGPDARCVGLFHDNPQEVAPAALRADACLVVEPAFDGDPQAGIEARTVDGGAYAKAIHRGPYEALAESYGWLMGTWLPSSGRAMAGKPTFEIYLNSPLETAPADLLTELYLPLA